MEELRNRLAAQERRLICISDELNGTIDGKLVESIQWNLCEVWEKILELSNSFAEVATGEEFDEVLKHVNGLQSIYVRAATGLATAQLPDEDAELDLENNKVKLPTFKGGYVSWIKFRRIFRSCVVENNAYDDCEKLCMLKSSVIGHPLDLIEHEEDFSKCWDLLHQMYHNRREIANCLAKQILELPKIYRNQNSVDKVIDAFKEIYSHFIELNMFDLWDVLTTNLLTRHVEEDVVSLWRATLPDGFIPPLDNLLQFLDHYVLNKCSSEEKRTVSSDN